MSRMTRLGAGLITLAGLFVPVALADGGRVAVDYSFDAPQIVKVKIGDQAYDRVVMPGAPNGGQPGQPALPACGARILLPMGSEVTGVEVLHGEAVLVGSGYLIEPVEMPTKLSADPAEAPLPTPDAAIYGQSTAFPGTTFKTVGTQRFRGYETLVVKLEPMQYVPSTGELYYYSNLTVVVETAATGRGSNLYRGLDADRQAVLRQVDNPELVASYDAAGVRGERNYDVLIITTPALVSAFEPLKTYHDAEGLLTEIHTTTEIGSTTPANVRNYILERYETDGIEYVIIGGDDDLIPARDLYVDSYSSEVETAMPGDIFFACLDGTWNYDGDGSWGEPTDGDGGGDVDLVAEVYIGRASVGNVLEAERFVNKTLWYLTGQHTQPEKVQLVGEYLGFGGISDYAAATMEELEGGSSEHGYTTVGIPTDDYMIDELFERDWAGHSWPVSQLVSRINAGVYLLDHLGHGSPDYAMKLYNADVLSDLTNTDLCLVYSQTCLAGHFDGTDCWAETAHIKTDHGAFAVVMNARYGWGENYSTDGPSQRFNREFLDAIFNPAEGLNELGRANQDSKEDNIYRIEEPCMRWCTYELNLFGDPTIRVGEITGLRVTPGDGLEAEGPSGGPFAPQSKVYTLQNRGPAAVSYVVASSEPWVTVTGGTGTLAAVGATAQVTVTINSEAASLSDGVHEALIQFTNTTDHSGDTVRSVFVTVGVPDVVYEWTLDTNPGWLLEGQWAFGQPTGGGGGHGGPDPTSGHTGSNIYGYNLSGDYTDSMPEYDLTSEEIDCTGLSDVHLKFWRWLGVEGPDYDHAYVRVSTDGYQWVTVWENGSEMADTTWVPMDIDISSLADDQPRLYVRWTMGTSDGGWSYCGWNIDDIQIVALGGEEPPLRILLPEGVPAYLTPGVATPIAVQIVNGSENYVGGTGLLHYRYDDGAFQTAALTTTSGSLFEAVLPPAPCAGTPEFYFSAQGDGGAEIVEPRSAPAATYTAEVGVLTVILDDDFETDKGWTVQAGADLGDWERADPDATSTGDWNPVQPGDDHTVDGTKCYVTGAAAGSSVGSYDVDGGPSHLLSPILDMEGLDATVSYWRWYHISTQLDDELVVAVSNNGGSSWVTVEEIDTRVTWTHVEWRVSDYVTPTNQVRLRFTVNDNPNNSLIEAAIDDVLVTAFVCELEDMDADGYADDVDNCETTYNPDQADDDHDGVGNVCDNCPLVYNPGQEDEDDNGIGDACEGPVLCAGDVDCSGVVDYGDIDLFVEALSCPGGAGWQYACPWLNADCNGDNDVTYADIDAFVSRIGVTCP